MFKTLCNWAILWDPHFNNYHFGLHKMYYFLSPPFYNRPNGESPIPHVISSFPSNLISSSSFLPSLPLSRSSMEAQIKLGALRFLKNQGKGG